MARTTRATRQQLDADGKQISPLVSLDDQPRRRRVQQRKKNNGVAPNHVKKPVTETSKETRTKSTYSGSQQSIKGVLADNKTISTAIENFHSANWSPNSNQMLPPNVIKISPRHHNTSPHLSVVSTSNGNNQFQVSDLKNIRSSSAAMAKTHSVRNEATPSVTEFMELAKSLPARSTRDGAPSERATNLSDPVPLTPPNGKDYVNGGALKTMDNLDSRQSFSSSKCSPAMGKAYSETSRHVVIRRHLQPNPNQLNIVPQKQDRYQNPGQYSKLAKRICQKAILSPSDLEGSDGMLSSTGSQLDHTRSRKFLRRPANFSRLRAHKAAKVYVTFSVDKTSYATSEELQLQGTYHLPKIPFIDFLSSQLNENKTLTKTDSSHSSIPRHTGTAKRKLETQSHTEETLPAPKRARPEPRPKQVANRQVIQVNSTNAKSRLPQKRYAKEGGYDKKGNLVFPGQAIYDTSSSSLSENELSENEIRVVPRSLSTAAKHQSKEDRPATLRTLDASEQNRAAPMARLGTNPKDAHSLTLQSTDPRSIVNTNNESNVTYAEATPIRGWNLAHRVTNSIGKLNPFNYFSRSAEVPPLRNSTELTRQTPQQRKALSSDDQSTKNHSTIENSIHGEKDNDIQEELSNTLFSVLQQKCPDIASDALVSTVQTSFSQSESSIKHKAEVARKQVEADPSTQKLLSLLQLKYPDLTVPAILAKLEEMITQQLIIANFGQEKTTRKQNHLAPTADSSRKRKRRITPDVIPNPTGKSYGMDLDFFGSSSSDESDRENFQDILSDSEAAHPSKKPKRNGFPTAIRDPQFNNFNKGTSSASRLPQGLMGDPSKPTPYSGDVFKEPREASINIFSDPESSSVKFRSNETGHFEVPSTSSDSEDENDSDMPKTPKRSAFPTKVKSAKAGDSVANVSHNDTSVKSPDSVGTATSSQPSKDSEQKESSNISIAQAAPSPPPAPTPSHAALPSNSLIGHVSHDPVALARAQANKYAPKTSSKLKSVSRLSNSPAIGERAGGKVEAKSSNVQVALFDPTTLDIESSVSESLSSWNRIVLEDPLDSIVLDPIVMDYLRSL